MFNCFWQFNYTKTRRFHAILMPVIIEFSRCIGTYSSAKFELINLFETKEEILAEPKEVDCWVAIKWGYGCDSCNLTIFLEKKMYLLR